MGAAGSLQDLRKVAVSEGRKLVQHHAENGPVGAPPLFLAFVALTDNQLQVLQQHFPKSAHRFGVLVYVQRDKQDQLLLDYLVE